GTVDLRGCSYEQIDDRRVRVSNSKLERSERFLVKLEGARHVGFRSSAIVGVRCPTMIAEIDYVISELKSHAKHRYSGAGFEARFLVYGRDAVMGELEKPRPLAHELGILI